VGFHPALARFYYVIYLCSIEVPHAVGIGSKNNNNNNTNIIV
jgi:hypothetical protein